ncbi:Nucleotide-diphospho-sugar transferases [Lasallia pustulata]|uniref:Nucleotide-diphospho-sugar transferases n=1 Tax=Lasallia pustulata TaxID=136370 RepID=A0A1W5DEB5_9LECA|nr:Nucleotide-diphospho-sugar transferases [Lasallia pustulata]
MLSSSQARYRTGLILLVFIVVSSAIWAIYPYSVAVPAKPSGFAAVSGDPASDAVKTFNELAQYFIDYPLSDSEFGELGSRVKILTDWIQTSEALAGGISPNDFASLNRYIQEAALALFPFIENPSRPDGRNAPLKQLRESYIPKSKGIVIATGKGTFRYACHLISNLRDVLHSTLPIQVAYAGEDDLPLAYREAIVSMGANIETLDITSVLNDTTLDFKIEDGGWAVKPFALLACKFEQAILLDADAVFLQKPEVIFEDHEGYQQTGTLLFHDRLLWQGAFKDRHQWWEKEMEHHAIGETLSKSKVYMEGYAEEGDSGVVAFDKGRLPVLMGLLHICWQNTLAVRQKFTYRLGYGDKESWWFGLALSGVPYTMEGHYGSILGEIDTGKSNTVCSFTIAHVDEKEKLLWYNGSLLKNKALNKLEFLLPSHWMMDGTWEKGAQKSDISCMRDGTVREADESAKKVVELSVENAKKIDKNFKDLIEI